MSYNLAVVGATGNVGREILKILAERNFPVTNIYALASRKSVGKEVSFGDDVLTIRNLEDFDFSNIDISILALKSSIVSQYVDKLTNNNNIVIDTSSYFRMEAEVPLIVPEVNSHEIVNYKNRKIISNPNCVAAPLALILKPIHDAIGIKRVIVSTYQSVSGSGKKAMDELYSQTKGKYMNDNVPPSSFEKQIAFNVLPKIGNINENGDTDEEFKISNEIKKIVSRDIETSITCVRVPVFLGHCASINIECLDDIDAPLAAQILENTNGIEVLNENSCFTPIECAGDDNIFVSRIRNDNTIKNALNMWMVSDNLKKGAALNAVQIAEELISNYI